MVPNESVGSLAVCGFEDLQLRELIERDRRQFAVVAAKDEQVAEDLVIVVPLEMQGVSTTFLLLDGPDRVRGPASEANSDLVLQLNAITRLNLLVDFEGFQIAHEDPVGMKVETQSAALPLYRIGSNAPAKA
jgi:hypothetical protein